jgi:excisionase family DNA binding protein
VTQQENFSKREAAEFLRISEKSLVRLIAERKLPVYNPVPGRAILRRKDLVAYMDSCAADPERPSGRHGHKRKPSAKKSRTRKAAA